MRNIKLLSQAQSNTNYDHTRPKDIISGKKNVCGFLHLYAFSGTISHVR